MNFQMNFRHSHGNLHVETMGGFDGEAAEKLLMLFCREYRAGSRIFVDTSGVNDIHPSGRTALNNGLGRTEVPASSLFFKGEKGFEMAPDGSRVLVLKQEFRGNRHSESEKSPSSSEKHHCCGRCAHCTCRHKHDHDREDS